MKFNSATTGCSKIAAAVAFFSSALFGASVHAVDLVANGSFETGSATTPQFCYMSASCALTGWTGNSPTMHLNSSDWGTPVGLLQSSLTDGAQILGLQNTSLVSQAIVLPKAGSYVLSWVDAGRAGALYGAEQYTVSFAGTLLGQFGTTAGQGWAKHQLTFLATGSGTLTFQGIKASTDGTSFIDKVSMASAVPEPASRAMIMVGLCAMGWINRYRQIGKGESAAV